MSVIVVVEPDGLRLASQILLGLSRDEQPGEAAFRQDLDSCRAKESGTASNKDRMILFQQARGHKVSRFFHWGDDDCWQQLPSSERLGNTKLRA